MKERITGSNRFKLIHPPIQKLPTHEERRWMAFVQTHVFEILNADPVAGTFGPEEVVRNVRNIADAICGPEYWEYEVKGDEVFIYRKKDHDLVVHIIVIRIVNN